MRHQVAANRDLYALLDLEFTADSNDIRLAYRRAALSSHPDKGGTKEAFHAIKYAFETLSSSATRSLYDQSYLQQLIQRGRRLPVTYRALRCKLPPSKHRSTRKTGLKRFHSSLDASEPLPKRHRCRGGAEPGTSAGQPEHPSLPKQSQKQAAGVHDALQLMRVLLQSMPSQQRLDAIQNASPHVRSMLLSFMQKPQNSQASASIAMEAAKRSLSYRKVKRLAPVSGCSGVRCLTSMSGTRYRAHLVIKGIRLYTNTSKYEAAIEHHITFVQMRDALAAESVVDPCLWTSPAKVLSIMQRMWIANSPCETMTDLHVFVYMRATPWLDHNTYIVSPVMQLDQAVSLYARLLSAQSTSWESLRAEWVALLQLKKRFQAQGQCLTDAEMIVDKARRSALSQRFKQAEQSVQRAMKREVIETKKAKVVAAQQMRRLAVAKVRAVALERNAAKERQQMWHARRKLSAQAQGKDMTMEDIMFSTQSCF